MREIIYMYPSQESPIWFRTAWPEHYPVGYYEWDKKYAPGTVFYYDMYGPFQELIPQHLAQGHKVIYDAKNESFIHNEKQWVMDVFEQYPGQGAFVISGHAPKTISGVKVIATPYWYWIVDQRSFQEFEYDKYQTIPRHQYKFFMQMGQQRPDRDVLFSMMEPVLSQGLYSYKKKGIDLPNDVDAAKVHNWQRYVNWEWIDSCSITLIVESNLDENVTSGFSITEKDNGFLSEKTYKPIAYGHAFLLAGNAGGLDHVRKQGFETFPELWDESYDTLLDYRDRIGAIVKIIQSFDASTLNNPLVQQKITHNRQRFFNKELKAQFLRETIVEPIINFANE